MQTAKNSVKSTLKLDVMWSVMGLHLYKQYVKTRHYPRCPNGLIWRDEVNYFYTGTQFMMERTGDLVGSIPHQLPPELQQHSLHKYAYQLGAKKAIKFKK